MSQILDRFHNQLMTVTPVTGEVHRGACFQSGGPNSYKSSFEKIREARFLSGFYSLFLQQESEAKISILHPVRGDKLHIFGTFHFPCSMAHAKNHKSRGFSNFAHIPSKTRLC